MNASNSWEFLGFGEMRLVYDLSLVQLNHGNSWVLVGSTLFMIEALCEVSAAKPKEYLGVGEMHLVYD